MVKKKKKHDLSTFKKLFCDYYGNINITMFSTSYVTTNVLILLKSNTYFFNNSLAFAF